MALIPRLLAGNYGNGVFGLKASLQGYDVTALADDNDVTKRSFNSEWPGLCKLKILGAAASEWTAYQLQSASGPPYYSISQSGWRQETPVIVPTGLSYVPIWEERVYDGGYFYDDYIYTGGSNVNAQSAFSGARSYHSGPTTSPANSIFFTPYSAVPNVAPVFNQNAMPYDPVKPFPGYPGFPAYPPKPTYRPALLYVIYSTKLGDVI